MEFKYYTPGSPPIGNAVVSGQSGPGNALRQFAQGIGQVRSQYGDMRTQGAVGAINGGGSLIGLIGRELQRHRQNTQNQKQMLGQNQVANFEYQLKRYASDQSDKYKQQFQDDPTKASENLRNDISKQADLYKAALTQDPQFKSMPEIGYQFQKIAYGVQNSEEDKIASWSLTQQTTNAHRSVENASKNTVDTIGSAQGSIQDKLTSFAQKNQDIVDLAKANVDVLGKANMEQYANNHVLKAGVAFFQNLVATPPDDPEQRLQYAQAVTGMVANNDKYGVPLAPDDKIRVGEMVHSMVGQSERDLIQHLEVKDLQADFDVRAYQQQADANWNNAPVQYSAIQFADKQMEALNAQKTKIADDPSKSEKVKNAYVKALETQVSRLDSLTKTANANLHRIQSEANADARAQKSEENAQIREERRLQHEADRQLKSDKAEAARVARAELQDNKGTAQMTANHMREEMYHLSLSAADNMPDILAKAKEGYEYANKMEAAGFLSHGQADADRKQYVSLATNAATWQRSAPPLFGLLGMPGKVHKLKGEQAQDARAKAESAITQSAQNLSDTNKTLQANADAGMSPAQQEIYAKNEATLMQKAQQNGWSPTQIKFKRDQLRATIMQSVPATSPPKAGAKPAVVQSPHAAPIAKPHPGNMLVPPPPPMTPSLVPGSRMTRAELARLGITIAD